METTSYTLFVNENKTNIEKFDELIEKVLKNHSTAVKHEVKEKIKNLGFSQITEDLVREIAINYLMQAGLDYSDLKKEGFTIEELEQIIVYPNKENANVPHTPEATNLTIAETLKKKYALEKVFSKDVASYHKNGDIHIHDLGFIDRSYCSGQSLEYIKKFGLNLPNALSIAKPAKHAEVLLGHMIKFSAALQGHFAGAIGWDAVNIFFAPFLENRSYEEIKQIAQMLIYEFSQQAVARGGQAIFSDLNIYWEIPQHFENVPAIGPGGEYTGKNYADYHKEAKLMAKAMFEVYLEGDATGKPFFFPKPLLHITDKFFLTSGWEEFLELVCEVASVMGNTYFVFDRGNTAKISQCCRLSFNLTEQDLEDAKYPWKMRYSAIQNVTINLPRIAYLAKNSDEEFFKILEDRLEIAVKAHLQKRQYLVKLLSLGSSSPLALLNMKLDGEPYLRLHRATHLLGMVGLNEAVWAHMGKQLHESDEAYLFGLKVISFMKLKCDEFKKKYGLNFVLEQTPAESTAYRFAKLDLEQFDKAKNYVQGNELLDTVYYTNSTHFAMFAPIDPITRVKKEGKFHPLIEAGALTHIWMGESQPDPKAIADFVIKTFKFTNNAQIAFSPEFTICNDCLKTSRGLSDNCPICGSENVDGVTRITGYFTKISTWNKGKLGELKDRRKFSI